jgi:hypothetical protein
MLIKLKIHTHKTSFTTTDLVSPVSLVIKHCIAEDDILMLNFLLIFFNTFPLLCFSVNSEILDFPSYATCFRNYLTNRHTCICTLSTLSSSYTTKSGVPQGPISELLLCSSFMNICASIPLLCE